MLPAVVQEPAAEDGGELPGLPLRAAHPRPLRPSQHPAVSSISISLTSLCRVTFFLNIIVTNYGINILIHKLMSIKSILLHNISCCSPCTRFISITCFQVHLRNSAGAGSASSPCVPQVKWRQCNEMKHAPGTE